MSLSCARACALHALLHACIVCWAARIRSGGAEHLLAHATRVASKQRHQPKSQLVHAPFADAVEGPMSHLVAKAAVAARGLIKQPIQPEGYRSAAAPSVSQESVGKINVDSAESGPWQRQQQHDGGRFTPVVDLLQLGGGTLHRNARRKAAAVLLAVVLLGLVAFVWCMPQKPEACRTSSRVQGLTEANDMSIAQTLTSQSVRYHATVLPLVPANMETSGLQGDGVCDNLPSETDAHHPGIRFSVMDMGRMETERTGAGRMETVLPESLDGCTPRTAG